MCRCMYVLCIYTIIHSPVYSLKKWRERSMDEQVRTKMHKPQGALTGVSTTSGRTPNLIKISQIVVDIITLKVESVCHVDFYNFKLFSSQSCWEGGCIILSKFYQNRSNGCWDRAIHLFEDGNYRVHHLGFVGHIWDHPLKAANLEVFIIASVYLIKRKFEYYTNLARNAYSRPL